MNGDAEARREIVRHTQELISINRNAMEAVDEDARRLGSAGAWAAVAVGFLSFLLSLLAVSRLQRRVVLPLAELYQVLEGAREGERLRRCRTWDAPREIALVTSAVNELLDERLRRTSNGTIEVEEKPE
jgi:nitrate/nitrite-specific signal transduction histidine kinase